MAFYSPNIEMSNSRNSVAGGFAGGSGYGASIGGGFQGGFGGKAGSGYGANVGGGFQGGFGGGAGSGYGASGEIFQEGFVCGVGNGFGAGNGENFQGGFGGGAGSGYGASIGENFQGGFGGGDGSGFAFNTSAGFGGAESSSFGVLAASEKQTMQNLNDRLAAYLEKVRALEEANNELEIKIRDWHDKQLGIGAGAAAKDYSKYYDIINDLRSKFLAAIIKNSEIVLEIDNARLAVDDFRLKYENELALRKSVEADINGLRKALDELAMSKGDFEIQIESLVEELAYLKKNHEEEAHVAKNSAAGRVNVEMDAAPGVDLTKILNDMREDYETLAEKNRRDAQAWFASKSNDLKKEISSSVQQVQTSKTEITDLRRGLQSLEMELQSLLTMKKSLEDTLAQTDSRYGAQLQQLQLVLSGMEEQLLHIRSDMERQGQEYRELLDIKTRLESEIETYRHLLEGELDQFLSKSSFTVVDSTVTASSSSTVSASQVESSSLTLSQTSSVESIRESRERKRKKDHSLLSNSLQSIFSLSYHNPTNTNMAFYLRSPLGESRHGASFGENLSGGLGGGFGGGNCSCFYSSSSAGFGGTESNNFGGFSGNEKETMQDLNDRLAAYLEKVKDLEAANTELETKIHEWHEKQVGTGDETTAIDNNKNYDTINNLKSKILAATTDNSNIVLQIDNVRLAGNDFKLKYEYELFLRRNVETDINGLRKVQDELAMSKDDFELHIESLTEEMAFLKKNHEEEMQASRSNATGQVNVKMDAAPGVNLTNILNDMRTNYETLAEKSRKDAEAWFAQKSNELKTEISAGVEQVKTSNNEVSTFRKTLQGLEIDIQSQLALKKTFEDTLEETECRYGTQLQELQHIISGIEEQLLQIRSDTERQSLEYKELLNIKNRLEMEIETYRRLLEGELG
ncbi:uncharacterized protein ACMZJ9_017671 [Mantella aurantiaca]